MGTIEQLTAENAALRAAVEARIGKATTECCNITANTKPFTDGLKRAADAVQAVALPADVPADFAEKHAGCTFVAAPPQKPAEFRVQRISASLNEEQLEAIWAKHREKSAAVRAAARGETNPDPIAVDVFEVQAHSDPYSEWLPPEATPKATVIGIAGRAGCGKNTVAGMVKGAVVMQLADPLYAALATMLGIPEWMLRHREFKERPIAWLGKSPRQMLQTLGTEWGRGQVAADVWIRICQRRIEAAAKEAIGPVVIADVRFANEAEWIRRQGGQVWLVDRDAGPTSDHSSEAGLPPELVDRVIDNRGGIEDTRRQVAEALQVNNRTMVVGAE